MRKEERSQITKEKILAAALKLMKNTDDPGKVTSRAIANEAGVPVGMINYSFGSREGLLYEAFLRNREEYLKNDIYRQIMASDMTPREKIRHLHYLVADLLIGEFKYTRAITGHILLNRDLTQEMKTLPLVRAHYGDSKEEWEIRMISYELSSMMQLVIYRLSDMKDFLGMDLTVKEEMHRLIDLQIDLLLEDNA